MASQSVKGVVVGLFVLALASSQPAPTILYNVHPDPSNEADMIATCPPTVASVNGAFLCFMYRDGQDSLQFVNPSDPTLHAPSTIQYSNLWVFPPIALSNVTAVAYSADPHSSWYTMFSAVNNNIHTVNRAGSVANVAYAPDLKMTFVPIGVNKVSWNDGIEAFKVTPENNQQAMAWSKNFTVPSGFAWTTQMSSPIYYRGLLMFMRNQTFVKLDASTGEVLAESENPCHFDMLPSEWIKLYMVTFGMDENGSLDAFILVANVTNTMGEGINICRVSHNSMTMEWKTVYFNDVLILDVIGGIYSVVLTGVVKQRGAVDDLITWSINATNGQHEGSLARQAGRDQLSFPAMLAQPVGGCSETMIVQVGGNLTAFCTGKYTNPVWVSAYPCTYRAAVHGPTNTIACVDRGRSIHLLDSDGTLLWMNPQISAAFVPSIVEDIVWTVDMSSRLYGLSISASATPLPPPYTPPQGSGLSGGAVLGIVVVLFLSAGAVAFAVVWYVRMRKQGSYEPHFDNKDDKDGAYGSLTS
jgi:hypothetical protein